MRVGELDKESNQDYIYNNHRTIFLNGRLLKLNKKHRLICFVINFINRIIKFYQLLKRLEKIKGVI